MALLTIGLNHTTAPVDLREQVAFDVETLPEAFARLHAAVPSIRESAILSTCNRTELFLAVDSLETADIGTWLADYHRVDAAVLEPHLYRFYQLRAAQHMMRVAAGLDSLVLGEPQIMGQFKDAMRSARDARAMGTELESAFAKVLSVAKRVRTETAIGRHPVSVAYASVVLAGRIFSELAQCHVALIGAGETIQLVAEHLLEQGVTRLDVINRTLANAEVLAAAVGGHAYSLDGLAEAICRADIVISSTGSLAPILRKDVVERALKIRRNKPVFMVDLAVPRDIEPEVGALEAVYLYTVDDLEAVIQEGKASRLEAAADAERLIDAALDDWQRELRGYRAVDTIRLLREDVQRLADAECLRALKLIESGKAPDEAIQQLARQLTNKFLHGPTVALRSAAERGDLSLLEAANRLFDLSETEEET